MDDVLTGVVETHMGHYNSNVVTGRVLPSREVSWDVSAERHVTFDEAKALGAEGYEGENDVPHFRNVVKDVLSVQADAEND